MGDTFDLFKQNENGEPIWIESVDGLHNLKKRLLELSSLKPGSYRVYDASAGKFIEPFKRSA